MVTGNSEQNENLRHMLNENLERMLNVDRLRVSIYNFYAIITGGLLAALMTQKWDGVWIYLFLAAVSLATWLINRRINAHVNEFTAMMKKIAKKMEMSDCYTDGAGDNTRPTLRNIYYWVPFIGFIVFLALFIWQLCLLICNG